MRKKTLSDRINKNILFLLFLGISFVIVLNMPGFQRNGQLRPLKIIASIFPLKEFASAVSGELGNVDLLIPPGAEIHTWQPRPSDLMKLSSADVFIYVGADLEPWVDDILRSIDNKTLRVVEASQGLTLLSEEEEEGHHGAIDPHIWLDFGNDQRIIDKLAVTFSSIVPGGEDRFQKNADAYKQKLHAMDEKYRNTLERCDHKTIVLGGHAAFGYLARRYGFSQLSLYGMSPDSKPTPRQLIDVIDFIKKNGITAVFFEVNISRDLAHVIAEETGAKTLILNPGTSLPRERGKTGITFLDIMEINLESLKDGLRCR